MKELWLGTGREGRLRKKPLSKCLWRYFDTPSALEWCSSAGFTGSRSDPEGALKRRKKETKELEVVEKKDPKML